LLQSASVLDLVTFFNAFYGEEGMRNNADGKSNVQQLPVSANALPCTEGPTGEVATDRASDDVGSTGEGHAEVEAHQDAADVATSRTLANSRILARASAAASAQAVAAAETLRQLDELVRRAEAKGLTGAHRKSAPCREIGGSTSDGIVSTGEEHEGTDFAALLRLAVDMEDRSSAIALRELWRTQLAAFRQRLHAFDVGTNTSVIARRFCEDLTKIASNTPGESGVVAHVANVWI
jgi:hypothetical protein